MTRPCPDHPRTLGATIGNCTACDREVTPPPPGFRAALPRRQVTHKHPAPPITDITAARERADQETP